MALSIFDFTDAEFTELQQNKSYVMMTLYCDVDIENNIKFKKKSLFEQFIALVSLKEKYTLKHINEQIQYWQTF